MGNFSRDTFEALKHYVGVRLQQGVPIVDADWNEMEDIRKHELETFLRWFVGNGVPKGDDGFCITEIAVFQPQPPNRKTMPNDFMIGPGRCLVDGWDVINDHRFLYTEQPLYPDPSLPAKDPSLADMWGVPPLEELKSPLVMKNRTDLVYLDVWEREVNLEVGLDQEIDDPPMINPDIGIETCVRVRREWVVRVDQGIMGDGSDWTPPEDILPDKHVYYPLALWQRTWKSEFHPPKPVEFTQIITVTDLRRTGLNLAALEDEIADARGIKGNLGNRLDESLTRGGQLRYNVVGSDQIQDEAVTTAKMARRAVKTEKIDRAAVTAAKIDDGAVTTDKIGDGAVTEGKIARAAVTATKIEDGAVATDKINDGAVTFSKINFTDVNHGWEDRMVAGTTAEYLIKAGLPRSPVMIHLPAVGVDSNPGHGRVEITWRLLYRSEGPNHDSYDLYLELTNSGVNDGRVDWSVYTFGE